MQMLPLQRLLWWFPPFCLNSDELKSPLATDSWECKIAAVFSLGVTRRGQIGCWKRYIICTVPHDRAFLSKLVQGFTWRVYTKDEILTPVPSTKRTSPCCFGEEKNFGQLDSQPSATTHHVMEALSSLGESQVGTPKAQELKVQKDHLDPQ